MLLGLILVRVLFISLSFFSINRTHASYFAASIIFFYFNLGDIAIPLGMLSAIKQNTPVDKVLRVLSYFGQGFPSFITALIFLIIAQFLSPLFPVGGMTSIDYDEMSILGKILDIGWHMVLPTIALSITSFAGLQRLTRGQLLDVLRQDYIQTARAKAYQKTKSFMFMP